MAEIDIFHYRKSSSILHLLDPGLKLIYFFVLSLLVFKSNQFSLLLFTAVLTALFSLENMQSGNISLLRFFKIISFFLIFLFFIVLSMWLINGGREGLYSGLLYSWKLLLLLTASHLFTSTTDTSAIQGAVYRILKPVPFVPEGRTAVMVSLTIGFIPLIFDQYLESKAAFDSRLGGNSKNPVRKIFSIAFPLMQNTIFRADEAAMAMESRCYSDNPSLPEIKFKRSDFISVLLMIILTGTVVFINYQFV